MDESGVLIGQVQFDLQPLPLPVTWGVMGVIVLFAVFVRLKLRKKSPGRAQQVVEAMLNWLGEEIRAIIGRGPGPFIPLVASLFIFILASNFVAFISSFFPEALKVKPPTADISTTAALATVVFLAVPFYGIAMTGTLNYLRTYVRPVWIMLPFNIISELSRTLALAVRLFGNILSGQILFGVMLSLVPFFLFPLLSQAFMFLALITGTIQAYIFAVLATVYIGGAVRVVEKHETEEKTQ